MSKKILLNNNGSALTFAMIISVVGLVLGMSVMDGVRSTRLMIKKQENKFHVDDLNRSIQVMMSHTDTCKEILTGQDLDSNIALYEYKANNGSNTQIKAAAQNSHIRKIRHNSEKLDKYGDIRVTNFRLETPVGMGTDVAYGNYHRATVKWEIKDNANIISKNELWLSYKKNASGVTDCYAVKKEDVENFCHSTGGQWNSNKNFCDICPAMGGQWTSGKCLVTVTL